MTRMKTFLIVAAAGLMLIGAYAWAVPPKGPGPVSQNPALKPQNPNLGPQNPNIGPMNPNLGPMNPNLGPMNPNIGPQHPGGAPVESTPGKLIAPSTRPGGTVVLPVRPYRGYRYGYGYGYGYNNYRYPRYYVVAEKRGPEITWNVYEWTSHVYARLTALATEKNATESANSAVSRELAVLRAQTTQLRQAMEAETDDVKRKELEAKLASAEALIAQKEASIRDVVRWVARGPMDARHLDDFLTQLEREAYLTRLKAGRAPGAEVPKMPPRSGY